MQTNCIISTSKYYVLLQCCQTGIFWNATISLATMLRCIATQTLDPTHTRTHTLRRYKSGRREIQNIFTYATTKKKLGKIN